MSDKSDSLSLAPFPAMTWCDCDWWEGEIDLSYGAGSALSVTPNDPSETRIPAEFQRTALSFHLEHGDEVIASVLKALLPYYVDLRPRCLEFLGDEADSLMPPVTSHAELERLIELCHVHIHPWTKNGTGYVGLQFGCTWDREHGLGFMMHRDRVVDIGCADVSFAWSPDEADAQA